MFEHKSTALIGWFYEHNILKPMALAVVIRLFSVQANRYN